MRSELSTALDRELARLEVPSVLAVRATSSERFVRATRAGSLDEVDPKLLETYNKLGISLNEQKALSGVAVDAVFDSVSVGTSYKAELAKHGILTNPAGGPRTLRLVTHLDLSAADIDEAVARIRRVVA